MTAGKPMLGMKLGKTLEAEKKEVNENEQKIALQLQNKCTQSEN